jgi:hypothetical protein
MSFIQKCVTLDHYKQLSHALFCGDEFKSKIELAPNVKEAIKLFKELNIPDKIILNVIKQISQYKFYISPNIYLNKLNLIQFFHCVICNPSSKTFEYKYKTFEYKYNIFYDCTLDKYNIHDTSLDIPSTYLKCFGGGITRGVDGNDFRLLPIEHFEIWLKILERDYVSGSRTFAKYKDTYTSEYYNAIIMRKHYFDNTALPEDNTLLDEGNTFTPHKSLYLHQQKKINLLLQEKNEEIKKLKKYIREY